MNCLLTTPPDGRYVAGFSYDLERQKANNSSLPPGNIQLWCAENGTNLWTFYTELIPLEEVMITAAHISPNYELLAAVGLDGVVRMWRITPEDC